MRKNSSGSLDSCTAISTAVPKWSGYSSIWIFGYPGIGSKSRILLVRETDIGNNN